MSFNIKGATAETAVVNDYKAQTTTLEGNKTWDDNDDQDGKRPESITIRVFDGDKQVAVQEVTAEDNWSWKFEGLREYRGGEKIVYTITEDPIEGYTSVVNGYDVTNTHAPETVEISGSKTWNDVNNQDGVRPESITIRLLQNGTEIDSVTVTAGDNWAWSFTDLPKYATGQEIEYTIVEDEVEGYTTTVDGYDVTNTHTPGQTSVQVTKAWDDAGNQDGVRPNSVTIKLVANGEATDKELTLNADNNWTGTFTELDEYAAGSKIIYTVAEVGIGNGYTTTITGDANEGFVATNSRTPETIAVEGSKTWDDADNQDGIRPGSITIRLLADGEEVASKQVTAADNWAWSFTDLPKFADGEEIVYTVTEDAVDGYTTTVDGYNVTNTHTPETVAVEGSKTWDDAENQDGKRPASITIRLLADGEEVTSKQVTATDNWTWFFTDLPRFANGEEIVYTIAEDAVPEYSSEIDGYDVTNTHTPGQTSVQVTKAWDDADDQDGVRPDSVTIKLIANGEATDKELTLNADNNWTDTFTELDEYAAGDKIVYTVEEVEIGDGYTTTITGDATEGYVVTNSRTPATTELEGMKTWQDDDNQDGIRPDSITVRVLANGEQVASKQVTAEDDWTWSFTDLPVFDKGQVIEYTIIEDEVEGYETFVDGFNLVNSHEPEMTMVEGSKTWDDNDNQNSKRPESITIRLLADGEEVASKQVTADDDWAWSFTDLPKFNSGKEIVYTITEDEVDGYTTTVDGYNVTNKIIPEEPKKPTLPKTGVATGTFLGVGTLLFVAGAALVGMRKRRS